MAAMKCGDPANPEGIGRKANGDPCTNPCVKNAFRCFLHGGASPAAKIKAEQQMALLRLPAIEALWKILEQHAANTCVVCGFPVGDADEKRMIVRTCQTILDRAGMGPHSVLDVRQSDGDLDLQQLTGDEETELDALFGSFDALKKRIAERLHGKVFGTQTPPSEQDADVVH